MEKKVCEALSKLNIRSSSISINNSELIPVDLLIEILSRLPAKSISRFRCLSKEWASILHRQYFTNLFLKMSSSHPRLLFSFQTDGKLFFLSAHQPLNPDHNSSPLVVDYHMSFPTKTCSLSIHDPVFGLVCAKKIKYHHGPVCHDENTMIYNPSTGQDIPLPRINSMVDTRTFLGYDPINKQYKVLCITERRKPFNKANEDQVLRLGTGKLSWKRIGYSLPHFPVRVEICINGVLYYLGDKGMECYTIVFFDVRSEKFKYVEPPDNIDVTCWSTMINYSGKLGVLLNDYTSRLEFWVLDDLEKNKWSQHIYVLPPMWKNIVAGSILHLAGMTGNGEIVFSYRYLIYPFYIFFYNFVKNSIARVRILGFESIHTKGQYINTYIDHIEDVKRM